MDRSLWLLLRLRVRAGVRRHLRSLRSLKGVLFLLAASVCFFPAFLALFMPGVLIDAQAAGDLAVLESRGRRALRVHIKGDVTAGLAKLNDAIAQALA